jgi:hypothetical protein
MSPQPSLFRGEIVVFLRQMAALLRHFNERNLPANLLSAPEQTAPESLQHGSTPRSRHTDQAAISPASSQEL